MKKNRKPEPKNKNNKIKKNVKLPRNSLKGKRGGRK